MKLLPPHWHAQQTARWRSISLGHQLSPYAYTDERHASAECTRAGCGMGFSITPAGAIGSAITFNCAGTVPVAESQTS